MSIKNFMKQNFKHFNSVLLVEAAEAYSLHLKKGGKMFMTLGGAMSTAELGISLAEMIRQNKVNAICSTGANLEEDIFNLVAHDFYKRISNWRELSPRDEVNLRDSGLNRVTDTCIPEEEAFRRLERTLLKFWKKAEQKRKRYFPYEFMYQIIKSGDLKKYYQIDPKNSWVIAACEKNIPIFTPGSEDSTLGNIFVSNVIKKNLKRIDTVKSGYEQMAFLIDWYRKESRRSSIGFFQIAGGIAGDFPICVVPLIHQDMGENCPYWGYFCQISDSTTSYGSYSGAVPNEKITWGKLDVNTPRFIIESDATIVAPLIFAYVLGK
ncbi:TPA: deoxyhypusine synthase [bacterium]|nr:MAG: deoxyhypusine synthase [Candidatus Hydrogenedentes bacterium CG1_02_42_14]HBW47836.1 deoxyhypusine synthase [bacterium]